MNEMESIKGKIEEQQKTQMKYREEENRRREDNESNTVKFLRMLDYKMDNIKNGEEVLFDRLADRSLKDGKFVTATITKKLEAIEENITAETLELDRKIGERLGRRTAMESKGKEIGTTEDIEYQIKETGKEITAEITKTIDTVLTECMQDLHNAITYGGAAPDDNSAVMNKIGALETTMKEEIKEAKKEITDRMSENKTDIVSHMETATQRNTSTQQGTSLVKTYAEATKIKNQHGQRTLHSVLVTSKNKIDTAEEVIGRAKEILEPEKNRIQIERIRKVKDQRVIISCLNEKETEQIREKISSSKYLEAERVRNKNPLVIIKEVKFKMTDDEIKNAIKTQNPDIYTEEQREEDVIKIKYRRRTKNNEKCHIIVQVPSEMWKKMVTKGHLYIEMERVRVDDQTPLIQYTRCLNYGHGKKFCPVWTDAATAEDYTCGQSAQTEKQEFPRGAATAHTPNYKTTNTTHSVVTVKCERNGTASLGQQHLTSEANQNWNRQHHRTIQDTHKYIKYTKNIHKQKTIIKNRYTEQKQHTNKNSPMIMEKDDDHSNLIKRPAHKQNTQNIERSIMIMENSMKT
ncbi:unnamed protein product [Diatraea saccharalis]|uniref:Uncharacterized protein n=1 Tax=Diatraea saccharalis TaxID=40085 RepID=A0A9N9R605_9NEOP|nr:unnamed protein product [Diatraea saccharalis]